MDREPQVVEELLSLWTAMPTQERMAKKEEDNRVEGLVPKRRVNLNFNIKGFFLTRQYFVSFLSLLDLEKEKI